MTPTETRSVTIPEIDAREVGGKGASLLRLEAWGLEVPPFFIIPSTFYEAIVAGHDLGDTPAGRRDTIARLAFEPSVFARLVGGIRGELAALPRGTVAVRSSALDEDGTEASFAGQLDTFLHVEDRPEAIAEAVVRCWQSLHSDRGMAYRTRHGLSCDGLSMAVVVQTMIPADRSWVGFSANVVTRDPAEMVVSAAHGLGDGLVSGAVDADRIVLDASTGDVLIYETSDQEHMVVPVGDGGVATVEVPVDLRGRRVLSDDECRAIHALLTTAASRVGRPVDVEGAFYQGKLHALQVRPITSPIGGRKLLWDNSNIVESYSGVTTPLTFSFASRSYQTVYTLFGRMLGVPFHVGEERERTTHAYLGLIQGRVYYNLLTWYESLAMLPGFAFSRGAMEAMMGVRESLDYRLPPASTGLARWTRDLPRMLGMIGRIVWTFATIDGLVRRFEDRIARALEDLTDETFEGWDAARCLELFEHQVHATTRHWQAPIMTDVGAMLSYAVLGRLCASWLAADGAFQNDLLAGEGGLESTQPTRRLMQMAARLRGHAPARRALDESPAAFFEFLERDPGLADLRADLADWMRRYGDRGMNELKLEEPSLRENPAFVAVMLRNYLATGATDLEALEARERAVRQAAEHRADEALRGHPMRQMLFRKVLGWTRKHVRNRENLRFARTRMFGAVRRLFRAIGADWVRQGLLRAVDDIFYLTVEEIVAYVDGRSVTRNLQALTDLRRAEFEAFRTVEPDERFVTFGPPHALDRYVGTVRTGEVADLGPDELAGTPCCPGKVEAVTRLVREPGDDLRLSGEILVAPRTDPGWVAIYPAVSGLLVEKGSILSHSAIVAREFGLPTIVGIKGLCARLDAGQRVRMDGTTGRVEILKEGNP